MKKRTKILIQFGILAAFLLGLLVLLVFLSPQQIVDTIGVENAYLATAVISLFGGFSAGGSATFIGALSVFAAGGANPWLLAGIAGVCLAVGDMIMFIMGSKGRALVTGKWDTAIDKVEAAINARAWLRRALPFLAFLYVGFAPLPNDVLILLLAAIEYPRRRVLLILILGDLAFAAGVVLLANGLFAS